MSFLLYLCITLMIVVGMFLMLLILIQKGRGGGLASAFGGAGGNTAFGSKTGDVLTWATSIVFGVFLLLAIVLNVVGDRYDQQRRTIPGAASPTAAQTSSPQAPVDPMNQQPPPPGQ